MKSSGQFVCNSEKDFNSTPSQPYLWYSGLQTFSPFSSSLLAHSGRSGNHLHSKKKPRVVYKFYKQKEPMDSKYSFVIFKSYYLPRLPPLQTRSPGKQFWPSNEPWNWPLDFIHTPMRIKVKKKKREREAWEPILITPKSLTRKGTEGCAKQEDEQGADSA